AAEWRHPERPNLAAIVLLSRHRGSTVAIERLRGAASVIALLDIVHMLPEARALGGQTALFSALTGLMARGVKVWRLAMPDDRSCLDKAAMTVLSLLPN